jgi:5,10-methylenetetrahydromethanopterin reductase
MLTAYAQTASAATHAAMSEHGRPEEFARAMSRLTRGEAPEDAIDDRLLAEYAIAGTPDECLAQAVVYAEAGVTELAIAPFGDSPCDDIARLSKGMK